MIQGETPIKRPDPGSFVLDCNIYKTQFHRSLCDLGSNVNLMPYSLSQSLGLTHFDPPKSHYFLLKGQLEPPKEFLRMCPQDR